MFSKVVLLAILLFPSSFILADRPCWLDLPKEPLELLGSPKVEGIFELDSLIHEYHLIPKTEESRVQDRVESLLKIESWLTGCEGKFLKNIAKAAREKRLYLQELEALRIKLSSPDYITRYFYDVPEESSRWTPLYLCNNRKYDSNLRIYWGEYFLEILDPCHRFLTCYFDVWRQTHPESHDYVAFFFWLEGQSVSFEVTSVYFFSEEEKSQREVVCQNGILCGSTTQEPFSCVQTEQEYLFIIDVDEKLFIAPGSREIRHDSLSYGKPLLASGNIVVTNGVVCRLGLESGHYQPTVANGGQLLDILRQKGVTFSQDAMLDFYFNNQKHSVRVTEFNAKLV